MSDFEEKHPGLKGKKFIITTHHVDHTKRKVLGANKVYYKPEDIDATQIDKNAVRAALDRNWVLDETNMRFRFKIINFINELGL